MHAALGSGVEEHRVHLLRTAPTSAQSHAFEQEIADAALSGRGERIDTLVRLAGHGRPWLAEAHGDLYRDGIFAVTRTPAAERVLQSKGQPVALATVGDPIRVTLERLSLMSAGVLTLQGLAAGTVGRPAAAEADIERCQSWIAHPILQYLTGRGAQRSVVGPWERYISDHAERLRRLQRAWKLEVRPRLADIPRDHPLSPLLAPLGLVSVERDSQEILTEYSWRLATLARECTRVSGEIGVVGVLGSLALTPAASALGALFVLPALLAGLAYYGGYGAATWVTGSTRARDRLQRCGLLDDAPPLSSVVAGLRTGRVRVLAGRSMAAADVGSAISLWLALLERSRGADTDTGPPPLARVLVSDHDAPGEGVRISIGGPLVRVPMCEPHSAARAACELTDEGGEGWCLRAGEQTVAAARDHERLGCLATALGREDLLFVCGTRDTGTVLAVEQLVDWLDTGAPECSWTLVR
jgi:hypothetical protein